MAETTKELIERWRKKYKVIKPVYSPLIKATIDFPSEGFNHLVYKNARRRPLKIMRTRLSLIPLIVPTIVNNPILLPPRIQKEKKWGIEVEATYYTFQNMVGKSKSVKTRVVVKKIGKRGKYSFVSVMKK